MSYRWMIAGAAMLSLPPASALATTRYGAAGCGLGSAVMGRHGNQVSAATTNGTLWSKYLGISFGTSNCFESGAQASQVEQEAYLMANYNVLSKEMAQGNGTSLEGLAELLGCDQDKVPSFKVLAQREHQKVFAAPGAVAALDTLKSSIRSDSELAESCKHVAAAEESEVSR